MMKFGKILSGLRGKLIFLAGVPFLVFLIIGSMRVVDYDNQLKIARAVTLKMRLAQASSDLVTQLQRERGRSTTYVSGGLTQADLDAQRTQTDLKLKDFQTSLGQTSLESEILERVNLAISTLEPARVLVNQKEAKDKVASKFSAIILDLLWLQIAATSGSSNMEGLMRISLLEAAKESMGKLRATVTPILTVDQPLTVDEIRIIVDLKSAAEVGLNAPALISNKMTFEKIKAFRNGQEWGLVSETLKKVIDRAKTGGYETNPKSYFDSITKAIDQVGEVIQGEFEQSFKVILASEEKTKSNLMFMLTVMVVVTAGIALTLFFVIRSITKPIQEIIVELQSGSTSVSETSDQISVASEQLSSAATEAAASFEETVASIEVVGKMVKVTSDKTGETAKLTQTSQKAAHQGEVKLKELISSMKDLESGSLRMEEIINVIDDIAFQTNLLALNAAVEAARAGEQGKGFAVVAEAVRDLASRSASAAKDISLLIKESVHKINNGAKSADESYTVLIEMVRSFTQVAENIADIADASKEQQTSIEQIGKAMTQLDQVTQGNAATAEEASASSSEMANQATMLRNVVDKLVHLVEGA